MWRLASPQAVQDLSWLKPGKVAWDWWNGWNIYGVDFESGINTPHTSSVGRLFDAVAALLGICTHPTYEAEPATLLGAATIPILDDRASSHRECSASPYPHANCHAPEQQAPQNEYRYSDSEHGARSHVQNRVKCAPADSPMRRAGYQIAITKNAATEASTAHDTSVVLLDAEPMLRAILDDVADGVPVPEIARMFHDALVDAIVQVAELARAMYGIPLVALSGGCFMNRYLVEHAVRELDARGFTVALNAALPPNDGCVSYGQAVVAAATRAASR